MTANEPQVLSIVIETHVMTNEDTEQGYRDTLLDYEFPTRYLQHFQATEHGEVLLAVLYEPRLEGSGRMSYVGWTTVSTPPTPSATKRGRWIARYDAPAVPFERPVPRETGGVATEQWLNQFEHGRPRNNATYGRAVRPLVYEDLRFILASGGASVDLSVAETADSDQDDILERSRRISSALIRRRAFAVNVAAAYGNRCAVTGLPGMKGLLEAAHIRPVGGAHKGRDVVTNGILLAPTVHRLFDSGVLGLEYHGEELVVVCCDPDLSPAVAMGLGLPGFPSSVRLPSDASQAPSTRVVDYHRTRIFGRR